jgi:hypothetical protein
LSPETSQRLLEEASSHVPAIRRKCQFSRNFFLSSSYSSDLPLPSSIIAFSRLVMSYQPSSRELSWAKPLSVDLLLKVLNVTFLHPFVAWMLPLCMRAQAMKWSHPAIQIAIGYASLLTALYFLEVLNKQIAFSKPRKVDFSDEVIVVTGGASGLGLLIAEVYGMRGATVAVLDVKDLESGEARGVSVYKCDVGDKEQVARVAIEIERDVLPLHLPEELC